MNVTYSSLCDTSLPAYLAYLLSVRGDGSSLSADSGVLVGVGADDGGDGVVDVVGAADELCRQGSGDGQLFLAFLRARSGSVVSGTGVSRAGSESGQVERELVGDGYTGEVKSFDGGVGSDAVRAVRSSSGVDVSKSDADDSGLLVRGRWYKKNKRARKRRGALPHVPLVGGLSSEGAVQAVGVPSVVDAGEVRSCVSGSVKDAAGVPSAGYFSGCSETVLRELKETRARRYVEENKLGAARAAAAVEGMTLERKTRLNEARFELKRQRVEVKLAALQEKRLGGSTQDWVESLLSGVDEPAVATPPLSVGSVSPNSSISVEQEKVLRGALDKSVSKIRELEMQLSKFTGVLNGKALVRKGTPDPYEGCFSDPPSIGVGDADFF